MRTRVVALTVLLAALPALALADRGALTLDLGPALTALGARPSQGTGSTTLATGVGGWLGVRYGLSNAVEVSAAAQWEAPADYFHTGVEIGTSTGAVRGTLSERVQRLGALVGLHYVHGFTWRLHLGAEVGWRRETFDRRDLLDVSDPGNVHSFGLGLQQQVVNALVLAPVAGVEWQFADHWSVSVLPRVECMVGGNSRLGLIVPVSVGYTWYVF